MEGIILIAITCLIFVLVKYRHDIVDFIKRKLGR